MDDVEELQSGPRQKDTQTISLDKEGKLKLEVMRHSSDSMQCDLVFGTSLRAIDQLNEILIQTGFQDTQDEGKLEMDSLAVLKVKGKEIVLQRRASRRDKTNITENYQGNGYTLWLRYTPVKKIEGITIFDATATLEKGRMKSVYHLIGRENHDAF